ncbi:hypothetical protein HY632_05165 [Candidatus Uhrbacteria bacterium]|nr:hypothetical protein [Candidatus Uhrbacteria bacterium]
MRLRTRRRSLPILHMRNINNQLEMLRAHDPLTETDHAMIAAHVRRAVTSRVGGFVSASHEARDMVPAIHMGTMLRRGMLMLWRPAAAFASVVVIMVSVMTVAEIGQRDAAHDARVVPQVSTSPIVTAGAPVTPGSGNGISVFGGTVAVVIPEDAPPAEVPATIVPVRPPLPATRRSVRAINPAPGVFTQWGTSVFSEEELLRTQGRVGVFSS